MQQVRSLIGVLSIVFGLSWSSLVRADVVVFPAERANITEQEGEAINAVFADAYAGVSPDKVTLVGAATADSAGAVPPQEQTARELGAKEYITLRATRLKSRIILTAARYSIDGQEIHRVRMSAASLDDIEPTTTRMARALYDRTTVEESQTLNTVTEREGQRKNRTFSEKVMGIKASIEYPFTGGSYEPVVNFGFNGRLEGEEYFLEIGAGFSVPSTGSGSPETRSFGGIFSEFGADYYLTQSNVSPYVGGGVMPRLIGGDGVDIGANIAVFGQLGLMFFRQSSSRLFIDARILQNLTPWRGGYEISATGFPTSTESRFPTELLVACGVGW